MNVEFDKGFSRQIGKINNKIVLRDVEKVILSLEATKSLDEIPHLEKMSGWKSYYRIRIGNFRIGLRKIDSKSIVLVAIADRKEIYKIFP